MSSNNFQSKKSNLLKNYLLGCKSLSLGKLVAKGDDYQYVVDNYLAIKTERGILNFYMNGANPLICTDQDYLCYDHFNLYGLYDELTLSFIEITSEANINKITTCFAANYDEFVGFSIEYDSGIFHILFSGDEIFLTNNREKIFSTFISNELKHFKRHDLAYISLSA
ncbi:hypothetical protein [Polycladidibacter stylochi]|uniref:hypothetical protein n=1 Tax=Polycladidibacter stylochi TaxID=1807766 RepID=UPI000B32EA94|nr:hypothetical protein [Pseudovibrio stylochi]